METTALSGCLRFVSTLQRFVRNERGATIIEYGLILLVVMVSVVALFNVEGLLGRDPGSLGSGLWNSIRSNYPLIALGAYGTLPLLLIIVAMFDYVSKRIPNVLVGLVVLIYVLFTCVCLNKVTSASGNIAFALVVLLGGLVLFSLGIIGGGDAKLLSALALWNGPELAMSFALLSLILLWLLVLASKPIHSSMRIARALRWPDPRTEVPFGVVLAISGMICYPHSVAASVMLPSMLANWLH